MSDSMANEQRAASIVAAVERQYGGLLQPGDLEFLRQRLTRASEMLAALERVHLVNSEEPDLVFETAGHGRSAGRPRHER